MAKIGEVIGEDARFWGAKGGKNKKMKNFSFCPLTIREDRLKSLLSVGDNGTQAKLSFKETRLSELLKPVDGRFGDVKIGELAQLGERNVRNVEVVGSTPILST